METLLGCLAIAGAAFMFGVVLNPFFWEGVRNRKFRNEQWHRYTDYRNGYSGIAKSYYIGKTRKINPNSFSSYLKDYIQNEGAYKISSVHSKLSKFEKFILLCELDNWDLENGDVYVVRIQTGVGVQVVIVSVDGNGRVTNWYCYDC